jgi:hypothetical protein
MSFLQANVRRVFGGKGDPAVWNTQSQEDGETLAIAAHKRMFKGPTVNGNFSIHGRMTTAAGAASALKLYYSNLPNPDPTNANHWVDSGVAGVPLNVTTPFRVDVTGKFPEWVMVELTVAAAPGAGYVYARSEGVEV